MFGQFRNSQIQLRIPSARNLPGDIAQLVRIGVVDGVDLRFGALQQTTRRLSSSAKANHQNLFINQFEHVFVNTLKR